MNILPPPGPQRRRQLILLGLLLVALAILVGRYWEPADPAAAAFPASNPQVTQTAAAPLAVDSQLPEPLKLGALEPVPDEPDAGRNPFRFGVRPPPPPPPAPPPMAAPPPGPPLPPPGPPPIPLAFIGRTEGPDGRVLVTLKYEQEKTGEVIHAYEGQIIDGRYRLVKVGLTSVVVAHLDGSNQRTLPLQ